MNNVVFLFILIFTVRATFSQQPSKIPTSDQASIVASDTLPTSSSVRDHGFTIKLLKTLRKYMEELNEHPIIIISEQLNKGLKKIDQINARINRAHKVLDLETLQEELGSNNEDLNSVLSNGMFLKIDRFSSDDLDEITAFRAKYITRISVHSMGKEDRIDFLKKLVDFPNLRELNLDNIDITDKELEAFIDSGTFKALNVLTLTHNRIHNPGAQALAATNHLPLLNHLDLSSNRIAEEGKQALTDAQHTTYEYLKELLLNDNNFNALAKPAFGNK